MKTKILFVMDSLRIGGVQSAFLNMLKILDYNRYEVTVQLFHYDESYEQKLPATVSVRTMPFIIDAMNCSLLEARQKGIVAYIIKIIGAKLCRLFGANVIYRLLFKLSNRDNNTYDVAVSFNNNLSVKTTYFGCNMYVLDYVRAKHRLSWLHVDYEVMRMNTPINDSEYKRFDRIVHVSNACRNVFLKYNPDLQDKSVVAFNVIDPSVLFRKAKEVDNPIPHCVGTNIVTVARLDPNKNIMACLNVAKQLLAAGVDFNWYILGDGQDRQLVSDVISQNGLSDRVHLLGYISKPYSYISNADILVSTSLSESFGMVIFEATVLGTPVIANDYPALKEIVKHGGNGFICNTEKEIFDSLYKMCTDKILYDNIKNNAKPILDFSEVVKMTNSVINI